MESLGALSCSQQCPLDPIPFHMNLTHNTLNIFQGPFQYYLHIYVLICNLVRSFLQMFRKIGREEFHVRSA